MKKRLLGILLCLVLFVTGCTQKGKDQDALDKIMQRGKIIVGVKYDTKPFGYINDKQQLVGYDIDLAKYIANSILGDENAVEFKQVTSSNRILALNSGEVDMVIATMTITPQRSQIINFSKPYFVAGQAVLVPQNSNIKSMSDLNGKKVIIIFGSTAEARLRLIAPESNIIGFKTYTSGYSALKQGRADAMTTDDTILMGFAEADKSMKLLPQRYTQEPYAVGFKKEPNSARLEQKVNEIIDNMTANGDLVAIREKWIKF